MKTISEGLPGIKPMPVPRASKGKPMTERQLVRWLKCMGAVPTPPEMKERLIKAGHWGMPVEDVNPFGK